MFPATTVVTTDGGAKCIADLQVGDRVLTHTGRFRPITQLIQSSYSGQLFHIKTKLIGTALRIMPQHQVLTSNGWVGADALTVGSRIAVGVPRDVYPIPRFDLAEMVYADNLEVEVTPQTIRVRRPASYQNSGQQSRWGPRFLDATSDLALFCGYYVSEGTVDPGERCVRFTFAKDETNYQADVARLVEKFFGISVSAVASNHGGWTTINVYSWVIACWLSAQFGRGATSKRLPVWLQYANPEIQTAFLVGILRGDGLYHEAVYNVPGRRSPKIFRALRLTLSNPGLIQQIWQMCLRLGFDAAVRPVDTTYVTENASPAGQISMPPLQSRELVYRTFGIELPQPDHRYIRPSILRQEGMIYFAVERVEPTDFAGSICSCEIKEDSSYVAEGVLVQSP